jgi:hypothetical protein
MPSRQRQSRDNNGMIDSCRSRWSRKGRERPIGVTSPATGSSRQLPQSANFPPYAETLWYALVKATEEGHVLASASTTGFYSATPSP